MRMKISKEARAVRDELLKEVDQCRGQIANSHLDSGIVPLGLFVSGLFLDPGKGTAVMTSLRGINGCSMTEMLVALVEVEPDAIHAIVSALLIARKSISPHTANALMVEASVDPDIVAKMVRDSVSQGSLAPYLEVPEVKAHLGDLIAASKAKSKIILPGQ